MNDEQLVTEHAQKFAAQFSGFLKACEIIGRGGALGQLADEAQKRYDDIAAKADELAAKHRAADEKLSAASAALEQAIVQAELIKKAAAGEFDGARAQAVSILNDARGAIAQEREAVLKDAQASGARLIADTHASLEDMTAQVAAKKAELSDAAAALVRVKTDIAEAQARWDEFRAKVTG